MGKIKKTSKKIPGIRLSSRLRRRTSRQELRQTNSPTTTTPCLRSCLSWSYRGNKAGQKPGATPVQNCMHLSGSAFLRGSGRGCFRRSGNVFPVRYLPAAALRYQRYRPSREVGKRGNTDSIFFRLPVSSYPFLSTSDHWEALPHRCAVHLARVRCNPVHAVHP